jgi:hypothetical protein
VVVDLEGRLVQTLGPVCGRLPAIGGLAGQPSCGRTQCSATSPLVYDHR